MEPLSSRNCLCDFDSCLASRDASTLDLNQLCPAAGSVEDCALSDLPDNVEFVTFSSGHYGEYSHLDRLNMVRLTLAEIEVQNAKACVCC